MENGKKYYSYILRLNPGYLDFSNWKEEDNAAIATHFEYLKDLLEKKILLLAGRSVNMPMTEKDFGIAILVADSEEDARSYMDRDPAIVSKIMRADLFEFSLALFRNLDNNK